MASYQGFGDCLKIMSAFASFSVRALSFFDQTTLMETGGRATLDGICRPLGLQCLHRRRKHAVLLG